MTQSYHNGFTARSPGAPAPHLFRRTAAACAAFAALLLAGCGGAGAVHKVTIDGQIPTPVVDPLPVTAVVHYTPEFSNYTSQQESLKGDTWQVEFLNLHQEYLHTILTAAFETVVISPSATPPSNVQYDVFIVPQVENFSFLTPSESGTRFFAASMRHFINLYGPDGTEFGAWEINSYGRSRNSFGRPVHTLAEEACLDAMRDFAASVAVGLPEELIGRNILSVNRGARQ